MGSYRIKITHFNDGTKTYTPEWQFLVFFWRGFYKEFSGDLAVFDTEEDAFSVILDDLGRKPRKIEYDYVF